MNNEAPRNDLCGTPHSTSCQSEVTPVSSTRWF